MYMYISNGKLNAEIWLRKTEWKWKISQTYRKWYKVERLSEDNLINSERNTLNWFWDIVKL